jgi:Superinfection immunity protein
MFKAFVMLDILAFGAVMAISHGEGGLLAALVSVSAFVYLLPTFIAGWRRNSRATAIFVLNIFLGWTFLGWVAALVWAFAGDAAPITKPAAV